MVAGSNNCCAARNALAVVLTQEGLSTSLRELVQFVLAELYTL
jgi:hypothetical protein